VENGVVHHGAVDTSISTRKTSNHLVIDPAAPGKAGFQQAIGV
jgi:hypothetical protein